MKRCFATLLVILAPVFLWSEQPLDKDFRLFLEYFDGEFNNYNQVNFETNDHLGQPVAEQDRHPWHHHTVRRVEAPAFGEHVFFAQINDQGPEGPVARQRVHVLSTDPQSGTIIQRFYAIDRNSDDPSFEPAALAEMAPDDLRGYPEGCEINWRRQADQFAGEIAKGACRVVSRRSGKPLYIVAELVLARDEMWHDEGGLDENFEPVFGAPGNVPYKLRRVNYFSCWMAFLKDKEKDDWDYFKGIRIHDQGGIERFTTTHDEPKKYYIQLKKTYFPASSWPDVFELFVHEGERTEGESYATDAISYAWTSIDADRIGINLRWMQGSCSLER